MKTRREVPEVGERVRFRHRGQLQRGIFIVEGYHAQQAHRPFVWLRHEARAAGHIYRLADVKFIRPRRTQ